MKLKFKHQAYQADAVRAVVNLSAPPRLRVSILRSKSRKNVIRIKAMKLELTSLENATASLERSVNAATKVEATLPPELKETVRSGIIQNFEVAYELSWKMMKRWIETNISAGSVDGVTRRELFRQAAENRLIDDVDLWMSFHAARNETSHTYDNETAEEVSDSAEHFVAAAQSLLTSLRTRND